MLVFPDKMSPCPPPKFTYNFMYSKASVKHCPLESAGSPCSTDTPANIFFRFYQSPPSFHFTSMLGSLVVSRVKCSSSAKKHLSRSTLASLQPCGRVRANKCMLKCAIRLACWRNSPYW